jgi:hypothetical protein
MLDKFYFFAGILMIKKYIMIENILLSATLRSASCDSDKNIFVKEQKLLRFINKLSLSPEAKRSVAVTTC